MNWRENHKPNLTGGGKSQLQYHTGGEVGLEPKGCQYDSLDMQEKLWVGVMNEQGFSSICSFLMCLCLTLYIG